MRTNASMMAMIAMAGLAAAAKHAGPEDGEKMRARFDREHHSWEGTYRRTEPRIGRNDPCPCESGKKFKRCHGAKP